MIIDLASIQKLFTGCGGGSNRGRWYRSVNTLPLPQSRLTATRMRFAV